MALARLGPEGQVSNKLVRSCRVLGPDSILLLTYPSEPNLACALPLPQAQLMMVIRTKTAGSRPGNLSLF